MANVLITKNGKLQYLESVDTGEYVVDVNVPKNEAQPKSGVIINPDISLLKGVDIKYWKISNGRPVEMTTQEKAVVDNTDLQIRKGSADTLSVGIKEALEALIKVINIRLPQGQKITRQEVINALREEIN